MINLLMRAVAESFVQSAKLIPSAVCDDAAN